MNAGRHNVNGPNIHEWIPLITRQWMIRQNSMRLCICTQKPTLTVERCKPPPFYIPVISLFFFHRVAYSIKSRKIREKRNDVYDGRRNNPPQVEGCNCNSAVILTLQMPPRSWFVVWNILLEKVHFLYDTIFAQHQTQLHNTGTTIELNYYSC